jgi:hypothetical protein
MRVRLVFLVATAIVLPSVGSSLKAATLGDIQGEVLVDHGSGFDIVNGSTTLNPGDSVIANPGGSALIVYDTECKVPVQPGAVVTVNKYSPCNGGGGFALDTTTLVVGGAVVGLGAAAAVLLTSSKDETPASP